MLSLEDLQKRSKALDLREALLEKKSRDLDETEANSRIEILNKQIEAKKKVLDNYNDEILKLDKRLESKTEEVNFSTAELDKSADYKKSFLKELETKKSELEVNNSTLKKENEALKKSISENKKYLSEQEKIVDETVADWNARLTGFQKEADDIEDLKTKTNQDIIRLEQEKTLISREVDTIQEKLTQLDYTYEERASELRGKLQAIEKEISDRKKYLDELNVTNDIRERNLSTREKAVKVKEVVLKRTEQDLQRKERKLRMDYGLAGETYE